jgi:ABC-2 type transport system permease protein
MTTMATQDDARSPRQRALVQGGTLSAGVLLVLALVLMFNYLSFRHFKRFDWTGGKIYTLSEKSLGMLRGLDKNIELVTVLSPGSQLGSQVYTSTNELVDRYVAANPQRIRRRTLDPARNPLEFERLVKSFGLEREGVVVVARTDESGNVLDKRVIEELDLAEIDYSGAQFGQPPSIKEFKGEKQITSAILGLIEAKKPKILFTEGHGEVPLDPGGQDSLSLARELLGKDNFDVSSWDALGRGDVPAGTDLVVVAGPRSNLAQAELDALGRYLGQGGRLLFFADPVIADGQIHLVDPALRAFFQSYGIEVNDDLVIDPGAEVFGGGAIVTDEYGSHPIVEALAQTRTRVLLLLARSIRAASAPASGWQVSQLVLGSQESWGETNFVGLMNSETPEPDGADPRGRIPLAVAASKAAEGGAASGESRIVVFGDVHLATDQFFGNAGNPVLIGNTFNWLVDRHNLIDIEARKQEKTAMTLSDNDYRSLVALVMLLLPGAAVVTGVWIAMRRRR